MKAKMKANELMVGDLFLYKGNIVEIVSIDGGTRTAWIDGKKVSALRKIDDLQPVPLSLEILEKNGFVKVFRGRYRFEDNSSIVEISTSNGEIKQVCVSKYDKNLTTILNCSFANMKYVHELQNIFIICRIEKTIEL